jgi:A/G-specific adenine glycosylase
VNETGERPATTTTALQESILAWYEGARRDLPFRATRHPYAVLVSEAMAQQTQAARAGEAWTRFMATWPTPAALAAATPADVLRAWQGLGYNRRALNLWRAARRIVEVHGGAVPADLAALQALPGVGPYTARAIGALAFGMAVGAVDTNVRRVIGRIVRGDGSALGAAEIQRVADGLIPPDRSGAWTHALMDLGATICRPRNPDCGRCPARAWCRFAATVSDGGPVRDGTTRGHGTVKSGRKPPVPFPMTSRWLRGRIVDRLRDAPRDAWTIIDGPIGGHDRSAVATAIAALARDGIVELADVALAPADEPALPLRARLPTS